MLHVKLNGKNLHMPFKKKYNTPPPIPTKQLSDHAIS